MKLLLTPFVWVLNTFYSMTNSYGLALILFAIVVKLILFPFQLKGKKGMIQMNLLSTKMQRLQKQYGKDKERYNEEVQKLYEREQVNPMSGCLWTMLPLFILLPLYAIIREPLIYLMNVSAGNLDAVAQALGWGSTFTNQGYDQLLLAARITAENVGAAQAAAGAGAHIFPINFDFLGIFDLSRIPDLKFWTIDGGFALFLLPIVSAASSVLFSMVSQKTNAVNKQAAETANSSTMKTMLIISPLISLWIGFTMPAALCLYWIVQNLFSIVQELISGKMLKKDYEEAAARQAEQERLEKEEEKERRRQAAEERARRIEEAKSAKGKKKKELLSALEKDSKGDSAVIAVSGIGMRSYARGRAYDPNRFSPDGPTPYTDPDTLPKPEPEKGRKKKESGEGEVQEKKETVIIPTPGGDAAPAPAAEVEREEAQAPAPEAEPVQEEDRKE